MMTRTTRPPFIRKKYAISIIIAFLVVVDSYVPSYRWKSFSKRSSLAMTSTRSTSKPGTEVKITKSLSANDPTYIQWSRQKEIWKMQTAVTTFRKGDQTVELHAQQHYGDADYFRYWNSEDEFNNRQDSVLFELLVDDELLEYKRGNWCVTQPIMASSNDQLFAQNLGLQCQASIIDYTNPKWSHADLSRQEFAKLATEKNKEKTNTGSESLDYNNTPLWKLASPDSSSTAAEAVAALMVGPPSLNYSTQNARKRRLFTNLFLPGGQLAFALRAILWMTVPAPELSIILLDWSSLLQGGSNPSALSEVALPILTSLVKFDLNQMRRFLFGQVVMSSKSNGSSNGKDASTSWNLLVIDRNDHALSVLNRKLEEKDVNSVALLYGVRNTCFISSTVLRTNKTYSQTLFLIIVLYDRVLIALIFTTNLLRWDFNQRRRHGGRHGPSKIVLLLRQMMKTKRRG